MSKSEVSSLFMSVWVKLLNEKQKKKERKTRTKHWKNGGGGRVKQEMERKKIKDK